MLMRVVGEDCRVCGTSLSLEILEHVARHCARCELESMRCDACRHAPCPDCLGRTFLSDVEVARPALPGRVMF